MSGKGKGEGTKGAELLLDGERPFSTQGDAQGYIASNELEGTHEAISYGNGWAVRRIPEAPAVPPASQETRVKLAPAPGLGFSDEQEPPPWATDAVQAPAGHRGAPYWLARGGLPERYEQDDDYWWVMFQHRGGDVTDPEQVMLKVRNETVLYRRGMRVPVKRRFLEVALNTEHPVFETRGNPETVVQDGTRTRFPFTVLGPCTKAEHDAWMIRGTEQMNADFIRYGNNRPPELGAPK